MKRSIQTLAFTFLLAGFWWLGGFEQPHLSSDNFRSIGRVTKVWSVAVMMFTVGAGFVVWAEELEDSIASEVPAVGLRIIGAMAMLVAIILTRMMA